MWFGMRLMTEAVGKESQLSRQQLAFISFTFHLVWREAGRLLGFFRFCCRVSYGSSEKREKTSISSARSKLQKMQEQCR